MQTLKVLFFMQVEVHERKQGQSQEAEKIAGALRGTYVSRSKSRIGNR